MSIVTELEEQLRWRNRSISLMREIDNLRDRHADEHELTSAIMGRLTEEAESDLGLLFLRDDETRELQLRTVLDKAKIFDAAMAQAARDLATKAAALPSARSINSEVPVQGSPGSSCVATSLRVGKESFGSLLLIKRGRTFHPIELGLINDAISQIDTALQHLSTIRELKREKRELETIYRIDHIRDSHEEDLQAMLDEVLPTICNSIEAQTGYIMLFDSSGRELELRAATHQDLLELENPDSTIHTVTKEAITHGRLINRTYATGVIRSILAQPLMLRDKLIGVLGVINRKNRPSFTRTDLEMLNAIGSQIDSAIFEGLESQRLRGAFGKCVGPQVMKRLLAAGDFDLLTGDRIPITALFSDIRGFTGMAERLEPELLQVVLNDHLSALTELVLSHEGTLDKYIGDSIMCFFNAPERQSDHALRAVRLALQMQQVHRQVIERWKGKLDLPPIGIGISTGDTMVGNFGSVKRLEYTVIGHDVNLAARLCSVAPADQIFISEATYRQVADRVIALELPPAHLKGIESNVRSWSVQGLR
jgi:adenylate cyclase